MTAQNWLPLESQVQVGPQTGGHKYAFMQLQYIESRSCGLAANWFKLYHWTINIIKSQILVCCSYTFSRQIVGRICWGINYFIFCDHFLNSRDHSVFKAFISRGEIWWWSLFRAERVKTCVQLQLLLRERDTSTEYSQVREKSQWFKKLANAAVFRRQQGWTCSRRSPNKSDLTPAKTYWHELQKRDKITN